jgi:hypothetical protein
MRALVREMRGSVSVLDTAIGTIRAQVRGTVEATPGTSVEVEFSIDVVVTDNDTMDTASATGRAASAHVCADINEIVGCVEAVDEDGMAYLRLAPDCLILLVLLRVSP